MLLLAHPLGNANFRATGRGLFQAGLLTELHSCICLNIESSFFRLLPWHLKAQLARRAFTPDVPFRLQRSHPWRELLRLTARHLPLLKNHELRLISFDNVCLSFDRQVAECMSSHQSLKAIYAYEDCALKSFQKAKKLGIQCIYDLPIGYWRAAHQIFEKERIMQPDWACTLTGLRDSKDKLARKDEELMLADQVIVPSPFVRSTLLDHSVCKAPIAIIPFGSPPISTVPQVALVNTPLRLLFVGRLGQRKGLSYVLEAVRLLGKQVTLTLIGRPTSLQCKPLIKALNQHRYIESLPHSVLLEEMGKHDVLVFPTLFEGYALVINEALSQGLPVITTTNSGGSEAIRNGVEGYIVPLCNSQAIAERLQELIDNRSLLGLMRKACLQRAAELSWSAYEESLVELLVQRLQ